MALSNYNTANWTYDAQGTKLRSTFFSMSPYVYYNEDYCGSFVFRDNELERVHFDEGYITLEGNNTQILHYYLKDHQGNVRMVVENGPNEQTNEYYPYGGLTYNSDLTNTVQPYKYNGKELDRIHGLDMYDYGARQYDPNIGRFTQVDPLAEKYYHLSPYAYCANNPVNLVDLNGEEPGDYFETIDKAAIDFGRFFNYLSITEKKNTRHIFIKLKIVGAIQHIHILSQMVVERDSHLQQRKVCLKMPQLLAVFIAMLIGIRILLIMVVTEMRFSQRQIKDCMKKSCYMDMYLHRRENF